MGQTGDPPYKRILHLGLREKSPLYSEIFVVIDLKQLAATVISPVILKIGSSYSNKEMT